MAYANQMILSFKKWSTYKKNSELHACQLCPLRSSFRRT